jgi:phosphoesterase RecJ-like protein
VTDTGWFRYGNTNPQSLTIASKLLATGIKVEELSERIYLSKTKTALPLLAWVLSHMTLHYDGRVALLKLPEKVFKDLGAVPDDVEEVVNVGLQMESVCASVLLKEKTNPPAIKASLRSKGQFDINQVARVFGGGGHRNASGCSISLDLAAAEEAILKEMRRVF